MNNFHQLVRLSRPFFGYIYPYANFDKCILFVGRGEMDISLKLGHDMCGKPEPVKVPGYSYRVDPVIEVRFSYFTLTTTSTNK